MIQEIKSINKEEIFKIPENNRSTLINKILNIFGYGKKG
jgi:hypothetical protein